MTRDKAAEVPANVASVVDLDRWPIHDTRSQRYQTMIKSCRRKLIENGSCMIEGFLKPAALVRLLAASEPLVERAHHVSSRLNYNLRTTSDDENLPADHPERVVHENSVEVVNDDEIPADLELRAVFNWPPLARFIADIMGYEVLYASDDSRKALTVVSYEPDGFSGWHFDSSTDTTGVLLLQTAEEGGQFETVPHIRPQPGSPDLDGLRALFAGDHSHVYQPPQVAGALYVNSGRTSIHRVSKILGARRRLALVMAFDRSLTDGIPHSESLEHIYNEPPILAS